MKQDQAREREGMLKSMSDDQREKFIKDEQEQKAHDAGKSKHVLRTKQAFKGSASKNILGGRGGRGGRGGGRGGRGGRGDGGSR